MNTNPIKDVCYYRKDDLPDVVLNRITFIRDYVTHFVAQRAYGAYSNSDKSPTSGRMLIHAIVPWEEAFHCAEQAWEQLLQHGES